MFDRNVMLRYHLKHNHYPPVSVVFVVIAAEAIAAVEAEDWQRKIELPNGKIMTASEIVEELHLSSFITTEEEVEV